MNYLMENFEKIKKDTFYPRNDFYVAKQRKQG